ncbi:hypothetical protein GCM10028862_10070 [Luteimonas pelagia]
MAAPQSPMTEAEVAARRRAARRTALVVGLVAVAVYVAFLATGILGR